MQNQRTKQNEPPYSSVMGSSFLPFVRCAGGLRARACAPADCRAWARSGRYARCFARLTGPDARQIPSPAASSALQKGRPRGIRPILAVKCIGRACCKPQKRDLAVVAEQCCKP
ncbi:unnamed protein product [Durusdinium trenchii]|uniref:Uncharacterized protein n=1 Tax=Durusdinium trenchii TaxID=1381693 RepID=A0ABP0SW48_9DINO